MKAQTSTDIEHLFLDIDGNDILPLHTSISLFLISYCDCSTFKVFLVLPERTVNISHKEGLLPSSLEVEIICRHDLPPAVQGCRLPAVVEVSGTFCRAGLAVVLRHIIKKTCLAEPCRKDVSELLGFKKTCLKACAEVSPWTRLCEVSIPKAVEEFLKKPSTLIPEELLVLEKKLGEPVRVHNDDKIRRQKLQQQETVKEHGVKNASSEIGDDTQAQTVSLCSQDSKPSNLDLEAALSKLTVEGSESKTSREMPHIRKTKNEDLPPLEHVFAEGLFFTLTDVVLLPCIHQFLVALLKISVDKIMQLPLTVGWYQRVQQVPGIRTAAAKCNLHFLNLPDVNTCHEPLPIPLSTEMERSELQDTAFVGGPRPTMTKLKNHGIEAQFSSHPHPSWTINWENLPPAASPAEGKMSSDRALRKQQQLNNFLSVVTNMAKPGDCIVDFCSGGGHVGIVLAHMLPLCQIILIENKEESLMRAKERSDELGLPNIWFVQANLDYFIGKFNIGVALHACGVATDMVIEHCLKAKSAFVICPCCYGFIQNTVKTTFPRSKQFQEVLSYKEHMILCRFADQTDAQLPKERRAIGKQCMGLVDLDRSWAAEQFGYKVTVISMEPETCSPKNNLIVGSPNSVQHV
ncbi:glutathione S-transferase C-terminal domain-containing protein [Pelobates fuscus]|uniref:glutathione S-transferase C-terminal domain-containing protein n=1 Tax=Pelobates fuscus TaxID=191477 RepID=UPI002FE4DA48